MMSGRPAGQHWPMSSRYALPSFWALSIASKCFSVAGVILFAGGVGPNLHEFWLPAMSMNHVPVRSNGALGRGLARFDGASGFSGTSGGACCACAATGTAAIRATAIAALTIRCTKTFMSLLWSQLHPHGAFLVEI